MSINIVRYKKGRQIQWGVLYSDAIYPISGKYATLSDFLQKGQIPARQLAKKLSAKSKNTSGLKKVNQSGLVFLSPVTEPASIVCQGKNYTEHRKETGASMEKPDYNLLFSKASSSLTGSNGNVIRPKGVQLLDYELELGLVIGKDIDQPIEFTEQHLAEYVVGLVMTNDISARDIQIPQEQWFKGKSYRTFCPVGPYLCLLEKSEFKDILNLEMELKVNEQIRQKVNSNGMVYQPLETLSEISNIMQLKQGDLLLTGTPGGVALQAPGAFVQKMASLLFSQRKKMELFIRKQLTNGKYLKDGDVITSTIKSPDGRINLGEQQLTIVTDEQRTKDTSILVKKKVK